MYGIIQKSIEEMVVKSFGQEKWETILEQAGVAERDFVLLQSYPDEVTLAIVGAATRVLGLSVDAVLESFGEHWITYAERGYGGLLRMSGGTFPEVVANLDAMHTRIKLNMPELRPPSFRCEPQGDGLMRLHYFSERAGLEPVVRGMLRSLARRMGVEIDFEQSRAADDGHAIFDVRYSAPGSWDAR